MARYNAVNNGATILANSITDIQTSFDVVDGSVLPASNFVIRIENEYMLVGTRSSNTLSTITRGYESSGAASHPDESAVRNEFTAGTYTGLLAEVDAAALACRIRSYMGV